MNRLRAVLFYRRHKVIISFHIYSYNTRKVMRNMKNNFEVRGDITVVFLEHKGEVTSTTISTEDLPAVSAIPSRWYAMNVGSTERPKYYVGTKIGGVTIYLHTLITKTPPKLVVDHMNHNPMDNTRDNLQVVTYAVNNQRRKGAQRNNKASGHRNVYKNDSGNWFVRLTKNGKMIHVGTYKTKEEAIQRAIAARIQYFGVA